MTHLMNTTVKHNYFGEGKVIRHSQDHITVLFGTDEKEFVYPDAFKDYLSIDDAAISEIINKEIKEKDILTHDKAEKSEQVDPFIITLESSYSKSITHHPRETKKKAEVNRHIAFKCNYCDGGKSSEQIGYNGVCSDEIINYNIDKKHYVWCSDEDSPCRRYYEELITRTELDASMGKSDENAFVCYESQMLRNWKAAAGVIQTGKNRGKPLKLKGVERNSLAILTTRLPSSKEKDRIIFGAFLVDETFEGDDSEEGFVAAKSEYKIKLSLTEAQEFKYWNYYFNPNKPETIRMGSGLFRYLSDIQATQVLRDMVKLKENTPEAASSKLFLEHFCRINGIHLDDIPEELSGGLLHQEKSSK